jgi:diacylglycerol kinase (ATP)
MKYIFIINPISGGKDTASELQSHIKRAFQGKSGHSYEILFTNYAGHAREITAQAVTDKVDIVVAAGGDGTMNEVCSALVRSTSAFGLIPMGSGNGFARSLGIPLSIEAAIQRLLNPKIISIDVGKINDCYFFGIAGVGLDAQIAAQFQEFGKRGPLPYFYVGFREFFKYSYEEITIMFDDRELITHPLLITVANTHQYGNGAVIAPHADYRDGLLDLCIIEKFNLFEGMFKFPSLFNNKIDRLSSYSTYRTAELHICRSEDSGIFHTDGEPHKGGRDLHIQLLKLALKVCS